MCFSECSNKSLNYFIDVKNQETLLLMIPPKSSTEITWYPASDLCSFH